MTMLRLTMLFAVTALLAAGCETAGPVQYTSSTPAPAVRSAPVRTTPRVAQATPVPQRHVISIPAAWQPRVPAHPWRYIVIHHSATDSGSATLFDREHKAKGWDELGYHFVIGNGSGSGNGAVEVGPRWVKQKYGAHAKTADNRFNNDGIGICLVGNFQNRRPSAQQEAALAKLVAYLMHEYNVSPANVIGHRDTKPTACPGRNVNLASVRQQAVDVLAQSGLPVPTGPALALDGIDDLQCDEPQHVHAH